MAKRKMTGPGYVLCVGRDSGPQCTPLGYNDGWDAEKKGTPTHVHKDAKGHWVATVWGPEAACTWVLS